MTCSCGLGRAPYPQMRVEDTGRWVTVHIGLAGVMAFKEQWPGSYLPDDDVCFEFDKFNGDLVDMCPDMDGPDALALSNDAWNYAVDKLGLDPDMKR